MTTSMISLPNSIYQNPDYLEADTAGAVNAELAREQIGGLSKNTFATYIDVNMTSFPDLSDLRNQVENPEQKMSRSLSVEKKTYFT